MTSIRTGAAILVAGAIASTTAPGAAAQQVDLTGPWIFEVTVEGDVTHPIVVLEQDGDELTGHYASDTLGESEVEGSVDGDEFTFSFEAAVDMLGMAEVTYTGTVEEAETLTGEMDLGGILSGSFTARPHDEDEL